MANNFSFTPDRVKAIRFGMGLTQKDFAERLGAATSTIAAWETGQQAPRRGPHIKALIDAERAVEEAAGVA